MYYSILYNTCTTQYYIIHVQSHIIAHSQGLTNGLSDKD